jgi:hypothetical protein
VSRLLACWELGHGHGHLAILAPAARSLAALGHENWLVAHDVMAPAALPDAPFARVLPAPVWLRSRATAPTHSFGQILADAGFADDDGLAELVRAWLSLIDLVAPAGLYGEHAPASLLAAHIAGLPAARLGTPFTCPPATRPLPDPMPWLPAGRPERSAADAVADRVVRSVCRRFGAPLLDGLAALLATAPPLLASWPELGNQPRTDANWHGPLTGLAASTPPDWPSAPGPRIFTYLGFERPAARPLAEALARRGWPCLWVSEAAPGFPLAPNIRHEAEPLAIRPALAAATVFVGRAGHGSSLDALAAGCPQLMLFDTLESEANAHALASRSLGRSLAPGQRNAAQIGAALDALASTDAPERHACAAAATRHAGYDAPAAAAAFGQELAMALRL